MNEETEHSKHIGAGIQSAMVSALNIFAAPIETGKKMEWLRNDDPRTPEQMAQQRREMDFQSSCPPLYKETDPARIPDQQALARVIAWPAVLPDRSMNPRGLLLVGEPGSGKTRAAWLKIRFAVLKNRCKVKCFDGIGWGLAVSKNFGDSEKTEEWVDECCRADILFIDDCFKARMTEAQEFAIFGVLDRRAAWKRPTIVTMNSSGAAIADRTAKAAGEGERFGAIMRRMTEFADVIQFKVPGKQIAGVK